MRQFFFRYAADAAFQILLPADASLPLAPPLRRFSADISLFFLITVDSRRFCCDVADIA